MTYDKLYLKITTVPNQMEVDMKSKEIEIFRNKYESHKNFIKDSDVELAYLNESAVNGSFAKVHSITLGFVHEGTPVVKVMYGEETDLLDKILAVLRQPEFSNSTVVMYNRPFVLSFLSKRLRKYNYAISSMPIALNIYDKKPWTIKGSKDIQDYVKGISYQTENFVETCFIHGIDADVIEGSDVARYIKKDQLDVVHQSDIRYVNCLMMVDSQLSESGDLLKVMPVIEKIGEVEKQELNALDHILAAGHLTSSVVEAIVKFTEENDLNKEDVLTLVRAALSKTKEYQAVNEEDIYELKEALGLVVDYSLIQVVADKGNLGKRECEVLIKGYKESKKEIKEEIVSLTETFLLEKNKMGQKRAKASFDLLKKSLLN